MNLPNREEQSPTFSHSPRMKASYTTIKSNHLNDDTRKVKHPNLVPLFVGSQ
ncbi:hypothetical protein M419DRAFT_6059 [Trichoderma reesei RUT C-30]|uniref:Uncharacterized protein n=1 Tax=Hypocrea jecorina (strain ATCC 56765 / BCRC 32924 / NRRL 11460 / Rut C-30) TaxID=1344414 RepID=A0A024SLC9_HYPJR|nr:hypothetical protein M419DRAFT_6059 [Trichoderma reesei RUT C-30]